MSSTIEKFPDDPANKSLPVKQMNIGTGPRLTNVGVSLIFWGKAWATNPPPTPSAQQYANAIKSLLNGNYLGSLAQYGVTGAPSLIAVDVASQSDPPVQKLPDPAFTAQQLSDFNDHQMQVFDPQLQAFVTSRIDAGAVPAPVVANTRFYAVILPLGFSVSNGTGEHQPFTYKGVAAATAWLLNDGTLDDDFSAVQGFSHELAEACSDPQGGGGVRLTGGDGKNWEISDVCRWGIDYSNGYAIQSYYSDADKACVIPLTRSVPASHAQLAVVSRAPDSMSIAVVGDDCVVYSGAWDHEKPADPPATKPNLLKRKGLWRGLWSINGGQTQSSGAISLLARSPHQLDAFVTGVDGQIYTAAWDSTVDVFDGAWRGWWAILTGKAKPGAPVAAVSRAPNNLDVFVVGTDGGVYTAAWDHSVASGAWRGWWPIGTLKTLLGGFVTAVSRGPNKLDVFAVAANGQIMTAEWDQNIAQGAWRGWWPIAEGQAMPGARIHAVSRDPNKLDVFVIGTDGRAYTAAWDQNVAQGAWRGWWPIGTFKSLSGGFITAVSRGPSNLDVFAIAADGEILTAAWDHNVAQGAWSGWSPIVGGKGMPGGMVSVVSRDPQKLDVFTAGTDGNLWSAASDQNVQTGAWRGWWPIPN